jgi:3-ketosteroid 9alpha-hydroxylase-like protein
VPALADTDGPILKFRKWYSQFYAEPYDLTG